MAVFLVVRTSNVLSMEKLSLLVHGKPITDQGEDNVGVGHRLQNTYLPVHKLDE